VGVPEVRFGRLKGKAKLPSIWSLLQRCGTPVSAKFKLLDMEQSARAAGTTKEYPSYISIDVVL